MFENFSFTSGDCDIFAIAKHRVTGFPIYVIRGYYYDDVFEEEVYEDCHIVLKLPNGNYLDYNGESTEEELKSDAVFNNEIKYIKFVEISEEEASGIFSCQDQEEEIKDVMKTFENFNKDFSKFNDWSGFNSREDGLEELEYLFTTDFPDGFNNIPEKVILYRLLLIENGEEINEEKLGEHYIALENQIDVGFLEKIGIWDEWDIDLQKLYLLTCETTKDNIDFDGTIGNRLVYPRENEFTLLNDTNIKILNKKEITKDSISI